LSAAGQVGYDPPVIFPRIAMFRLAIVSLCVVFIPLAAAAPEPKKPDMPASFLPSSVGDTLVIEETRSTADGSTTRLITRTVKSVDRVVGHVVVVIQEESKGSKTSEEVYDQSDAGLFILARDGQFFDSPLCVARLPLKAGDTWEVNDPAVYSVPLKFTTGEEEEIKVPAGRYKAVRIEKKMVLRNGKMIRVTDWAAPGIGVVKVRAWFADGSEAVQILKSFTPAKK
jgi:hypothetical protein